MNVPADLRYNTSHEWVRLSGDIATVGITDHAQAELTDVVFVEPPAVGRTVDVGDPTAVVESVKAASDIYAPCSGEVVEINPAVEADPSLINTDPYGQGWIFKLKLANPEDAEKLLDAAAYTAQIG
ncbi:MAG: glycine cleavage system protein GcvH [Luteolibacter sp.]|jgi:glycine cleavage system H protein